MCRVLPTNREMQVISGFTLDPVGETSRGPAGGLLHKYQGRALLVVTGVCAVHCPHSHVVTFLILANPIEPA